MSEMQAEHTEKLPYDYIKIGLTRERAELYRMIDERVEAMIEQGLIDEVRMVLELISVELLKKKSAEGKKLSASDLQLLSPSALSAFRSLSSLQAIGYKELVQHIDGNLSLPDAIALIKQRSRNYAKRQFTWFRKEEGINWVDITGIYESASIGRKLIELVKPALLS